MPKIGQDGLELNLSQRREILGVKVPYECCDEGKILNITDERLKARAMQAISLQEQGCFIQDYRRELPLPAVDLRYSHARDELGRYYDYECSWGKFCFDPETRSILVLRQGTPPDELLPQPRLSQKWLR